MDWVRVPLEAFQRTSTQGASSSTDDASASSVEAARLATGHEVMRSRAGMQGTLSTTQKMAPTVSCIMHHPSSIIHHPSSIIHHPSIVTFTYVLATRSLAHSLTHSLIHSLTH